MPPSLLYTAGYSGRKASDLVALVQRLDATLVDVRIRPVSRVPGFSGKALSDALGSLRAFPDGRYLGLTAWGNAWLGTGSIQIQDWHGGLLDVEGLPARPAILLCQCRDEETCHRAVLRDRLRALGYAVRPLDWDAP